MKRTGLFSVSLSVIWLIGCAPLTAPVNKAEVVKTLTTFDGPTLSPVSNDSLTCPNISGKYWDRQALLLKQFPRSDNRNEISVNEKVIRGDLKECTNAVCTFYYHDTTEFYEQAIIEIQQETKTLIITLMDKQLLPYKRLTIALNNPMIGCHDGHLIIRSSYYTGGAEGALGYAYTEEKQLNKLSNGALQVKTKKLEWYYSYYEGLIGFGPDNHAKGDEPRNKEWTLTFPAVK